MFNTIKEAVEYGKYVGQPFVFEKDGKYNTSSNDEYDYAVACGWTCIGTVDQF